MIKCYHCGLEVADGALDGHVATAHPDVVSPLSPRHVERIATGRQSDRDWRVEDWS